MPTDDAARALVRLAEAVRTYLDVGMIVPTDVKRELLQAQDVAETINRERRIDMVEASKGHNG